MMLHDRTSFRTCNADLAKVTIAGPSRFQKELLIEWARSWYPSTWGFKWISSGLPPISIGNFSPQLQGSSSFGVTGRGSSGMAPHSMAIPTQTLRRYKDRTRSVLFVLQF